MLKAMYLRETEKAVLVDIEGVELWIPESQIGRASQIRLSCGFARGDIGWLEVSDWLARKKGLQGNGTR